MPTKVVAGENCVRNHAELLAELGHKALVVTGAHSAKVSGALADVLDALDTAGCPYVVYDKISQNPTIDSVFAGAAEAKRFAADFVVAIGGGSPMDAGKAISLLARNPQLTPKNLFSGEYPGGALPVAAVPTTAGTGSEVTKAAVLTNDAAKTKTSITHPLIFPKLAFLDGRYTQQMPIVTTVNTAIDALSHAAEGMLSIKANFVTDCLAAESLSRISGCFSALQDGSLTVEQRQSLLAASTLAGMVIANTGTTAVHAMGYSLTYFRRIPHGRANGLLLPNFLRFEAAEQPERVGRILSALGCASVDALETVFCKLLGTPETLTLEEAKQFAAIAFQRTGSIQNCVVCPTEADLLAIYRASCK